MVPLGGQQESGGSEGVNVLRGGAVKATTKKMLPIILLVVPFVLTATARPALADTEHDSRTVPYVGGTLTVKSFSGRVTITGSDRTDVAIEATRTGTREALDRNKLEIDGDRSRVRIVESFRQDRSERRDGRDQIVETEFTIQVPWRVNLDVDLFWPRWTSGTSKALTPSRPSRRAPVSTTSTVRSGRRPSADPLRSVRRTGASARPSRSSRSADVSSSACLAPPADRSTSRRSAAGSSRWCRLRSRPAVRSG